MRNIEHLLQVTVQTNMPVLKKEEVCALAIEEGDDFVNVLFHVINTTLDQYDGTGSILSLKQIFGYLNTVVLNISDLNRKIIERRLKKLIEKLDTLKEENQKKYKNYTKTCAKLEELELEVENSYEIAKRKENRQYDFLNYLIHESKNINYLEKILEKKPSMVNTKAKDGESLIRNILDIYFSKLKDPRENQKDLFYYDNVILLIMRQKALDFSNEEKRKCLEKVYCHLDQVLQKRNKDGYTKERVEKLTHIKNVLLKGEEEKLNIEQLSTKYHIPISFDERLLQELKFYQTKKRKNKYPDRILSKDYIITIDEEKTKVIDDGISCRKLENGNYLLGVHVASVLGYLPYESELVQEALKRTTSIYLSKNYQQKEDDFNRVIPIFPYSFAAEQASLSEGSPHLARSYYFEIDPKNSGEIVNQKFLKTIVYNQKRLTYKEVNQMLVEGTENERLHTTLQYLKEATDLIYQKYKKSALYEVAGSQEVSLEKIKLAQSPAARMISTASILTGNKVAEYFANSKEGYPCLYHIHELDPKINQGLEDMVSQLNSNYNNQNFEQLYHLLTGIYPKGRYGLSGKHMGLNLEHYCQCTSGLRRAADIAVEHALEVCYDKNPKNKELENLEKELAEHAIQMNAKIEPIDWFKRDYKRAYTKTKKY